MPGQLLTGGTGLRFQETGKQAYQQQDRFKTHRGAFGKVLNINNNTGYLG
jgi:hypothetical protein